MSIAVAAVLMAVAAEPPQKPGATDKGVPKMLDLGSVQCIPCKMMAPILEGLKNEFAGKLQVDFVDVNEKQNLKTAQQYNINIIPTQIFMDSTGKELWRHEGFISRFSILDKFRELGYEFAVKALEPAFSRMEPAKKDERLKENICYMCDGDINPKTAVVVKTEKGDVKLCGLHCFFIMYSCVLEGRETLDEKTSVTDWATGKPASATKAFYLYALDEKSGKPVIKAFAERESAANEQKTAGGSIIGWEILKNKELACRCGFCDRAIYPEDSALVKIEGVYSWGCCPHCALGIAARTGKDIEIYQPDRLTGEMVVVKTIWGYIKSIEPSTAVAWFGMKKKPDGTFGTAGCFHQGFFAIPENLKNWVEQYPLATGKMITIDEALSDKMKMTPEQIKKACKLGECAPK
jgi:thioredoxin 1